MVLQGQVKIVIRTNISVSQGQAVLLMCLGKEQDTVSMQASALCHLSPHIWHVRYGLTKLDCFACLQLAVGRKLYPVLALFSFTDNMDGSTPTGELSQGALQSTYVHPVQLPAEI